MRVYLAPQARCIYLDNDSDLDWHGVCMHYVCFCVALSTLKRRMLRRLDFGLADWLPGRGTCLQIYLLANTQRPLLFSFFLHLSSAHGFFWYSVLIFLLHLWHPLCSLSPSALPALLQKSPLLIHNSTLHTWLTTVSTGPWFSLTAHTHTFRCVHTLLPLAILRPPFLTIFLL